MEPDVTDLDRILEDLFYTHDTMDIDDTDDDDDDEETLIETVDASIQTESLPAQSSSSATSAASASTITDTEEDRPYYLIVFNNPKWSAILERQRERVC